MFCCIRRNTPPAFSRAALREAVCSAQVAKQADISPFNMRRRATSAQFLLCDRPVTWLSQVVNAVASWRWPIRMIILLAWPRRRLITCQVDCQPEKAINRRRFCIRASALPTAARFWRRARVTCCQLARNWATRRFFKRYSTAPAWSRCACSTSQWDTHIMNTWNNSRFCIRTTDLATSAFRSAWDTTKSSQAAKAAYKAEFFTRRMVCWISVFWCNTPAVNSTQPFHADPNILCVMRPSALLAASRRSAMVITTCRQLVNP
mmetsp:Transcript_9815/g.17665  ORF Transcript_9815/g.17665 Transcript_9815/m.17665 type:complete len:262 (+) Transcript_9815:1691-2476(+)